MNFVQLTMSLTFSTADGWIICHLQHLNDIYTNVSDGHKLCTLKFNKRLFDINSRYLRQNQISTVERESNISHGKMRKRKKSKLLVQEDVEQVNHIKQALSKILSSARAKGLFTSDFIPDNNEAARTMSQKFYSDTFHHQVENLYGCNKTEVAIISEARCEKYVFPKRCCFYCYDVRNMAEKMETNNQFDFILMDPPWWNKSIRRKKLKYIEASYKMMYNEELAKIPVEKLLSPNGIVAVWCTNAPSHLRSILDDMFPAWGVTYRAKWYWVKVTRSGDTVCEFNPTPGKQPYELVILGSSASNTEINIPDGKLLVSIPSAVHSHKPPIAELVAPYLPSEPNCLEIFARYLLPGWTSWGLEVLKFQHLSLYSIIEQADENNEDINTKSIE